MPEELWAPYTGMKLVAACPMDEFTFQIFYKRQSLTAKDKIRKTRIGYKVTYPDGYEFWMFKELFEGAYREITDSEKAMFKNIFNQLPRSQKISDCAYPPALRRCTVFDRKRKKC